MLDPCHGADKSTVIVREFDGQDDTQDPIFYNNLRGSRHLTAVVMDDPADGQKRLFFLFNDLSVRTMGEYAIGCFIFDLRR
ncbi:hypothetical protein HDU91_000218 [Kappamyces sp. JEL0680]|nr:hypothetical protein HDU91_000218 [Kappamyces sp. JEL0680]